MARQWLKVVFAADCEGDPENGPLTCPQCSVDYAECPCPGPHQPDEYEYREQADGLYARRRRVSVEVVLP